MQEKTIITVFNWVMTQMRNSALAHTLVHDRIPGSTAATLCVLAGMCVPLVQTSLLDLEVLLLLLVGLMGLAFGWRIWIYPLLIVLGLFWASYNFHSHLQSSLPSELEGESLILQGRIEGLPRQRSGNIKFLMRLNTESATRLNIRRVELTCYRCELALRSNQEWKFKVRLKRPHGYASWGAWNSEKSLFRHQVSARGYLRGKESHSLIRDATPTANLWRQQIKSHLNELKLPSEIGLGIISALSIGDRSALSPEQHAVFQATGVSHLMAISGLHVGLVFALVQFLSSWMLAPFARIYAYTSRQTLVLIPAMLAAVAYASLAGFAVSTQRALVMLAILTLSRLLVRECSLLKILLMTACVVLVWDPFSILDAGFWLSAGAVFVIALASREDRRLSLLRLQPLIWLGMLPLTSLLFGQVSLVSPFANLIAVPLFSLALIPLTLLSVLLLELGLWNLGVWALSLLAQGFQYVYEILELLANAEYAKLTTPQWSITHWLAITLIILLHRQNWKIVSLSVVLFLFVLFYAPQTKLNKQQLELVLLDVGQGLAMVVRTADYVLVYDTGPRFPSGFSMADAVVLPFLRSQGISRIDTLIVSHADNDHIGGYQSLQEAIPIKEVLSSRVDVLPRARSCVAGQQWSIASTVFDIIGPDYATPAGSNNLSCVLSIRHFDTRILITGDIEQRVERYMLQKNLDIKADILLVPHQGSKTSSTVEFIEAVKPSLGLIAAGYQNHYGHPHPAVVDRYHKRGIELASTIDSGSIWLKVNDKGWKLSRYRKAEARFWMPQKVPQ